MLCLTETFTPEINLLRGFKQDLRQRLSYMLSCTEPETLKSEPSLEELQQMVEFFGTTFFEIHLLLKLYETELGKRLGEVTYEDSTDDDSGFDPSIVH